MGISYPEPRRYSPVYSRRSDPNFLNGFNTTVALIGTGAPTTVWCHRIYPNIQGAITKYAIHNNGTAFSISAGTASIKTAIYKLNESGFPTTKLKNSDATTTIATSASPWGTFSSRVFIPGSNVELDNPLEPLLLCWVSNLNTVTISTGGTVSGSVPVNVTGEFHPYSVPGFSYHLDLEVTIPTMTFSSFAFPDEFSTLAPSAFIPRNSSNLCNIDWYLAFAK